MEIFGLADQSHVDLAMPAWNPGSYLLREYARHVQNLRALGTDAERRSTRKLDKSTWRVDCSHTDRLTLEYEVFSHDLTVRTNHLDDSHGFFNGVALFLYPTERLHDAVDLHVLAPPDWKIFCALPAIEGAPDRFHAKDFDELFDSPVEMGDHDPIDFEVEGKPHRMVIWGRGNYGRARLAEDIPRVVASNAKMFGGLPYENYLFIVHLTDNGYGGLEHRNSTVMLYARQGFADAWTKRPPESQPDGKYVDFLRLTSHEHFHVWNVKRIRPAVLGPFDYQRENYTRELWSVEGVTSYYDTLLLLRGGILDAAKYLEMTAKRIKLFSEVPGRKLHSLEQASFEAWTKLYRPDEHTNNSSVSYYLKGELVSWMLDLWMRDVSDGHKSLDDVLRFLWEQHLAGPEVGYAEGAYEKIVSRLIDADVAEFFDRYVRGTDEIDWQQFLEPVGLRLETSHDEGRPRPWMGVNTRSDGDRLVVTFVPTGSPAHRCGLYVGDEIVAMSGLKASSTNFGELLKCQTPGDVIDVHVFRRGELLLRSVTLGESSPDSYKLLRNEDASDRARGLLKGWLGTEDVASTSQLAQPKDNG